jgi:dTDP-4-amino-4,6-dideoxy-D-galactose acyltransferase
LSDPDEAQVALGRQAGFKKVDVRVELVLDLASQPLPLERASGIRRADDSDLLALKALASQSHRNTRFYTDTSFPTDRADALYAAWIERSFEDPTQTVYVSGRPGQPDGYIAFGVTQEGHGLIGLIAVTESSRGKGLGAELVRAAISWATARGLDQIEVTTQGNNQSAKRLYQSLGFEAFKTSIWLHRWT